MAKQYNIRWGRRDYAKLSHLTRKVNKKIFEIEVKRPDINQYQPDYLDYQQIKGKIKTRADFNRIMSQYERYLREGAEEISKTERGGYVTKWGEKELKLHENRMNRKKQKELATLKSQEVTIAGEGTGNTRAQMGNIKEISLQPTKTNIKQKSQEEIDRLFRKMEREMFDSYDEKERAEKMRRYVKGLIAEGYSDELINLMEHIEPKEFERFFYLDEVATIDFIYGPEELKIKDELMREFWQKYAKEEKVNNFDFDSIRSEVNDEYASGQRIKGQGRVFKPRRRRR